MEVLRSIFGRKTTSPNGSATTSSSGSASGGGFGRSRNVSSKLKGKSYDSAIALDPPVKGLYPVAGNGPNVLDELQRSKARRNASRRQSVSTAGYAEAPNVPRWREDIPERPSTAPHSGLPSGHLSTNSTGGRTLSGFASRTSPFMPKLQELPHRNTPSVNKKPVKEAVAYQPKRAFNDDPIDLPPPILHSLHNRTESSNSRASYIDLLDAHSIFRGSRDGLTNRIKASGIRSYGEDVADRNIVDHGGSDLHDQASPPSNYHRKIHSAGHGGSTLRHTRLESAFKNVREYDDDTQPQHTPLATQTPAQSQSQTALSVSGSRPSNAFPLQSESASAYQSPRGRIDDRTRSMRRRTLSSSSGVIHEEPSSRASRRQSFTQAIPSSSFSTAHERASSLTQDRIPHRYSSAQFHSRQDSAASSTPNFSRRTPLSVDDTFSPTANETRTRPRTSSATTTNSVLHQRSVTGSSNYVPFPHSKSSSIYTVKEKDSDYASSTGTPSISNTSQQKSHSSDLRDHYDPSLRRTSPPISLKQNRRYSVGSKDHYDIPSRRSPPPIPMSQNRNNYVVEGAKERPSLDGIVDLTNTVDTEVITTQAPAVTHEYVTPKVHHIREEVITREIHTHDVFHRILPVIETEILPTKHYIQSADGTLKEIPADQVPGRTNTPSFQIVPTDRARKAGEALPGGSIVHIGHRGPEKGPVLSSKKHSMTSEGVPKTEYVWRHAPTLSVGSMETGQSVPMYFNDGSESDEFDHSYTTGKRPEGDGDDMLFRDSGYGSGGMLPGLAESAPTAIYTNAATIPSQHSRHESNDSSEEGEATKALRRRREAKEKLRRAYEQDGVSGVTRGLQTLDVNDD